MRALAKGQFFVVPRFVVENLGLESGPMRDIYCIIYNISQDGSSACECTVKYFMDWTGASERNVRSILGELVKAGYITRTEIGSGRGSTVEYMATPDVVEACKKGANFAPIKKGANPAEKGANSCRKGCKSCTQDNNNIIIYNNFSSRVPRARKDEEEEIYKFFYFRNAAKPRAEMEAFFRVNDLNGWVDSRGRALDSWRKKLVWAAGWRLQEGGNRVNGAFLDCWCAIYGEALRLSDPMAASLVDSRLRLESDRTMAVLHCSVELKDWLEEQICQKGFVWRTLGSFLQGRKFSYQILM